MAPSFNILKFDDDGNDNDKKVCIQTPRLSLRPASSSDAEALHEAFSDPEVMRYWSSLPHTSLSETSKWMQSMINSPQNGHTDFIITLREINGSISTSASPPTNVNENNSNNTKNITIGKIGIFSPLPANEIGFLLARKYWGQGLAREAMECMLKYLFNMSPESQQPARDGDGEDEKKMVNSDTERGRERENRYTVIQLDEGREDNYRWRYPSITADVDPRNEASLGLLKRMGFEVIGSEEKNCKVGDEWMDSVYLRLRRDQWLERKTSC